MLDDGIYLCLSSDVNAAGGFVEDEDVRI